MPDPFIAIAAMSAITSRPHFSTNVLKLPLRDPLLTAKQIATMAVLSGNRVGIGVGRMSDHGTRRGSKSRSTLPDKALDERRMVAAVAPPDRRMVAEAGATRACGQAAFRGSSRFPRLRPRSDVPGVRR